MSNEVVAVVVPVKAINGLTDYLAKKPYMEVMQFFEVLNRHSLNITLEQLKLLDSETEKPNLDKPKMEAAKED